MSMMVNAVIRTKSITIGNKANFIRSMKHRLKGMIHDEKAITEYAYKLYEIFSNLEAGGKKLRKNATLQEIVVALERKLSKEEAEHVKQVVVRHLHDIIGFEPTRAIFTHHKDNRTHLHIVFSLRDPDNPSKPKFRWKKQHHYQLVKNVLKDLGATKSMENLRRKKPRKPYDIWFCQMLRDKFGKEKYRIIMDYALENRLQQYQLMAIIHREWDNILKSSPDQLNLILNKGKINLNLNIDIDTDIERDLYNRYRTP